jgi:hypothetical protein
MIARLLNIQPAPNDGDSAVVQQLFKCLSPVMTKGDLSTPLDWECQFGHRFKASPTLVLLGGHWCPECLPLPWNYDEIAKGNPFFAQVWYPFHDKKEHNVYDESIFTDFKE